jgi:3'-phosphoadenosine 5'-phosphosulfate sulfotransferase (PAPS reductase)/FAD synthetase
MPLNENNIIKNDTGRYPNEDSGFFHAQNQYHAVSLSGGKDSTALLLLMIERGMPIDAVISADTGMEFPEMYDHLAKVDDYLFRERGIHVTTLRHPHGFEWLMFEEPKQKKSSLENRARMGVPPYGNGWPGIRVRWCTGQLKTHLITKEVNRLKKEKNALHYVGIAADEAWRCKGEVYPLVEWGITEAEALQACYDRGFDFGGLYEIYHRASCWCCPFQRIDELRKLRQHHPALWARLLDLDSRAIAQFGDNPLGKFKQNWTVAALDARFAAESAA